MDVVTVPLDQLIPYARNPRHNERAIATVAASLKEFGWRQPIVVDEEMVIIAGHTRLEAARQLGLTEVPVHIARGLTPAQAKAYRLMDNRASENAEWDEALLGLELDDLQLDGFDLHLTGFDDDELDRLLRGDDVGAREDEDDVPEPPAIRSAARRSLAPRSHQLLCGDATVADRRPPAARRRVPAPDGHRSALWRRVRSRPGGTRLGAASTRRTGKVLNDDRADWREAWALFPGDVAYVWHGALHAATVAESLEAAGFAIRSQIIWAKERLVLSPRRLPLAARAVLVRGQEDGQGPLGGRSQADDALDDLRAATRTPTTVHGTQKPVECMRRPILNNSSPGPGGLRAVHGLGHDADRRRDDGPHLPRHRAQPGLCRRRRRALAAVHRRSRRRSRTPGRAFEAVKAERRLSVVVSDTLKKGLTT